MVDLSMVQAVFPLCVPKSYSSDSNAPYTKATWLSQIVPLMHNLRILTFPRSFLQMTL